MGATLGRVFKIRDIFLYDIWYIYQDFLRASLTPLGRVFKIGKRLCKILSVFVVDKSMIKWVTPLGVR